MNLDKAVSDDSFNRQAHELPSDGVTEGLPADHSSILPTRFHCNSLGLDIIDQPPPYPVLQMQTIYGDGQTIVNEIDETPFLGFSEESESVNSLKVRESVLSRTGTNRVETHLLSYIASDSSIPPSPGLSERQDTYSSEFTFQNPEAFSTSSRCLTMSSLYSSPDTTFGILSFPATPSGLDSCLQNHAFATSHPSSPSFYASPSSPFAAFERRRLCSPATISVVVASPSLSPDTRSCSWAMNKRSRSFDEDIADVPISRTRRRVIDSPKTLRRSTDQLVSPESSSLPYPASSLSPSPTSPETLFVHEHSIDILSSSSTDFIANPASLQSHDREEQMKHSSIPETVQCGSSSLHIGLDRQPDELTPSPPGTIPCQIQVGGRICGVPLSNKQCEIRKHFTSKHTNSKGGRNGDSKFPASISECPFPVLEGKSPCDSSSETFVLSTFVRHVAEQHFPEKAKVGCSVCLKLYTRKTSITRHKCRGRRVKKSLSNGKKK